MVDSTQAERAVLGAILLDGSKVYEVMPYVREDDFSLTSNQKVYRAILNLADGGKPVDIVSLSDYLNTKGEIESVGGFSYIASLTDSAGINVKHYADSLREFGRRRRLTALCDRTMARLNSGESLDESLGDLEEGLLTLRSDSVKPQARKASETIGDVYKRIMALRDRKSEVIGFTTGLQKLDESTTGIRPGEIWVVGALPGRGKTSIGLQIAIANADHGIPVAVFSLEMAEEQLLQRALAAISGVSAMKIREPRYLNATDMKDIEVATERVMQWPLYVDESSQLTTQELTARARLYKRRFGVNLIVVDYLRLVDSTGKELRERVGNAANSLRQLAKDEKIAVVALSQLRRPQDINDRPTMVDLKESGDIEAHAHTVILLYQPIEDAKFTGMDEVIIGKQRNGPLGTEAVVFDKKRLMFLPREV